MVGASSLSNSPGAKYLPYRPLVHKQNGLYGPEGPASLPPPPPPPPSASNFPSIYVPPPPHLVAEMNVSNELDGTSKSSLASQMFWQFLGYGGGVTEFGNSTTSTGEKAGEEGKFVYAVEKMPSPSSTTNESTSIDSLGSNSLLDERSSSTSAATSSVTLPTKLFFVPNEHFSSEHVKHFFSFYHQAESAGGGEIITALASGPVKLVSYPNNLPRTKRRKCCLLLTKGKLTLVSLQAKVALIGILRSTWPVGR